MLYKLGAVPYLNALPLIHFLEEKPVLAAPAALARLLKIGQVDIATAPIVTLFENPQYALVPGICIGSNGPVRSVKLFFNRPGMTLGDVRSIYLDMESKTSALLLKVLLKFKYGRNLDDIFFSSIPPLHPIVSEHGPDRIHSVRSSGVNGQEGCKSDGGPGGRAVSPPDMIDATLLIGDKAMKVMPETPPVDLGFEWTSWTGLPFVYAAWISRHPEVSERAVSELAKARDQGIADIGSVIPEMSPFPRTFIEDYLRNIVYRMGPKEAEGIALFREYLLKIKYAAV